MYAINFVTAPNVKRSGRTCKPAVQSERKEKQKCNDSVGMYIFKRKYAQTKYDNNNKTAV